MVPASLIAFFGSQAILRSNHILQISFSAPRRPRAVLGGALYLTVIGVLALGLGAIIRNTAGGIAIFVAIIFVIPPLPVHPPARLEQTDLRVPALEQRRPRSCRCLHGSSDLAPVDPVRGLLVYIVARDRAAAVMLVRRDA